MNPTTDIGKAVDNLWTTTIYGPIKDIGGTLAIATFVCSAFYFFIIGKNKNGLELAKGLMIGAGVGIAIIYFGPGIISFITKAISNTDLAKGNY